MSFKIKPSKERLELNKLFGEGRISEKDYSEERRAMSMQEDIERAKKTTYHHPNWYIGGQKSVYDAIKEMASTNDFVVDVPRTLLRDYQKTGYDGEKTSTAFVDWLIKNKKYEYLIIRYTGSEGGTDKGALKLKLFLHFKELVENMKKREEEKLGRKLTFDERMSIQKRFMEGVK